MCLPAPDLTLQSGPSSRASKKRFSYESKHKKQCSRDTIDSQCQILHLELKAININCHIMAVPGMDEAKIHMEWSEQDQQAGHQTHTG